MHVVVLVGSSGEGGAIRRTPALWRRPPPVVAVDGRAGLQRDRQVREPTALVAQSQNLVSYHLRQLRKAGLVSSRRSAADARDT